KSQFPHISTFSKKPLTVFHEKMITRVHLIKHAAFHLTSAVMRAKLEILALVLGAVGLVGTIAVTSMPMWKVTAYIGSNLIVMETLWEGLWMACIRQADINMQCKVYDSLLILPADIQAARGLMCASITLANVILLVGGCLFVVASLATLLPVSWSTHSIIRDFYNPMVMEAQKREIGQALYVGFATFLLLLIAGVILLCRYGPRHRKDEEEKKPYITVEKDKAGMSMLGRTPSSDTYPKSQYV
uniref:Claudin n=1 Tax=Cyprinus carpio TaxID=7962 RepID=A0A8C1XSC1_CYPCA